MVRDAPIMATAGAPNSRRERRERLTSDDRQSRVCIAYAIPHGNHIELHIAEPEDHHGPIWGQMSGEVRG